jgi:glutamine amidotransferase
MFNGISENENFYFLHSYFVSPRQDYTQIARTRYCDMLFCSAIEVGNVWGVQFHPEKSAGAGLKMLKNFLTQGETYDNR